MTSPAPDLAAADAVATAVGWLAQHDAVTAALGGPGRIGTENLPPYPRLVLSDPPPGSTVAPYSQVVSTSLLLEVLGDRDGTPGKADLCSIAGTVVAALAELPARPYEAGRPIVTHVQLASEAWEPYADGQPRYTARVLVFSTPPN